MAYNLSEALHWGKVLKEVGIWDLARFPGAFVCRIVDHGRVPLAFVSGVGFLWPKHGALSLVTFA